MPATSTEPKRQPIEPGFWQRYSPRHECPISFSTSLFLIVLILGGVSLLPFLVGTDSNKPPLMDIVEIEGGGGGLGSGIGPGQPDKGDPSRKEAVLFAKADPHSKDKFIVPQIDLKNPPKSDIQFPIDNDINTKETKDPFAELVDPNFKPPPVPPQGKGVVDGKGGAGDGPGKGGGKGGGDGTGSGAAKGPGGGTAKQGGVLNDQRRRELRWVIFASPDGDIHVKKLQALKVTLIIPLRPKPGEAMQALSYDLSKSLIPTKVKAVDDPKKVRWVNKDAQEMIGLAKALRLSEIPPFAVIYLPSDLEADMARRELAYQGRQEFEIQITKWDVRERDGSFENEPYIVQQILRPGVK